MRAKEAASDDGGVHIRAQIRQWTTITDRRYDGQRPNLFWLNMYFYLCCNCICNCIGFCICTSSVFLHVASRPQYDGQRPNALFSALTLDLSA